MVGDKNWMLTHLRGSAGPNTYMRDKHGCPDKVIIQQKPKRKSRTAVEKAHANLFREATKMGRTEYQDPEKRAVWEAKYAAEPNHRLSDGKKKPLRLWDYICRELYEKMKAEKEQGGTTA